MSLDTRLQDLFERERLLTEREKRMGSGSGEGGGGSFVDQRVSRLEGQYDKLGEKVDRVADNLSGLTSEMAAVKERLTHMPTRFEFYSVAVSIVGFISAVVVIVSRLGS